MAVGVLVRFAEGMGAEQYDAVTGKMGLIDDPPEGLIFHSAGELEGHFQVFNVWETSEHAHRFARERLRPAQVEIMGEERVAAMRDGMIEIDIHKYLIP